MSKQLTDYDADCAEAAAELWSQLANHGGEDADAQIIICAAFKEYACEHDKRITESEWAQKYREACVRISELHDGLSLVVNSGPLNNGLMDEATMAQARAALG